MEMQQTLIMFALYTVVVLITLFAASCQPHEYQCLSGHGCLDKTLICTTDISSKNRERKRAQYTN